jgi:hypothetical protein
MSNLGYKQDLLKRLQMISEATADEAYSRLESLPAKELVGLLSSSIQLQSLLEKEIAEEKRKLDDSDTDRIVDVKMDAYGVDRNKVVNLLDNYAS